MSNLPKPNPDSTQTPRQDDEESIISLGSPYPSPTVAPVTMNEEPPDLVCTTLYSDEEQEDISVKEDNTSAS
jgi:hypothetical protein